MSKNPLEVIATSEKKDPPSKREIDTNPAIKAKAYFDRLWLQEPERFAFEKIARERIRFHHTIQLISETVNPSDKKAVDLGCGSGILSRKLRDKGAHVTAVDISKNALKRLKEKDSHQIETVQGYAPKTSLPDNHFTIVMATELIAYLTPKEQRILISEMARLITKDGYMICSTLLDIESEDALQRFADLIATEFTVEKWVFSHHFLQIKFYNFFKAPSRFFKAWKNKKYREKSLAKRHSLAKLWFKINSASLPASFWYLVQFLFYPIHQFLRSSDNFTLLLEKLSKAVWGEKAISHALCIGKLRPLIPPIDKEHQPKELKHKKQVWE